ncbi:MAG: ROK family protein [Rhodospirillales bacterium]|nr:ROK family protein [Rhodospirillales bacterium]
MRIGIDLGGTKIEGIILDDNGRESVRLRVPTPGGNYPGTVDAIACLVADLEQQASLGGKNIPVGVGIPGTLSPATSLVKNANSTCLIGHPLDADLARALKRPVRLANDANCFAISEATDGAGKGFPVVFGVILGTGVGGGLVVNGKIVGGINGIAGEWGHNPLPWPTDDERPGAKCYCGLHGCIETFLSGTGLAVDYQNQSGEQCQATEIAALENETAQAVLAGFENRLARALASVINILDPDIIVLGGGLSNIKRLYDNVPGLWNEWVFSDRIDTRLVANHHGDSSGVRGAAWLWN